ncbi:DNA-binding protein [Rhodanobacter glycinis]|uniref:Replication region DNA-binding N-term n=1 Tax=Rhodanobacter glycinis TaxID=582702 RepID=A0A1I3YB79_9GAMM|nr:DNA-binding protein [Rhodanobacter glycinis]SFK29108.1 replication region DNA-binding N-term [Rhodanobacter glycinis]HWU77901.1 DNA-binding protein [Rhodanobacter sp.]
MAKGITQDQVSAAADALVTAGERPTVEKIRARLGTGSPNTVTRMLDTWRGALATRLSQVLELPELPGDVGQAFTEVWRLATTQAGSLAQAALAQEQNALLAAQSALTQERKLWDIALAEAQEVAQSADQARQLAETRLADMQRLVEQQAGQLAELTQQRDTWQRRAEQLDDAFEAHKGSVAAERESQASHVRAVEDRAHAEIDRAREESKILQATLRRQEREASTMAARLERALDSARVAEHRAAEQRTCAKTFEQQLARMDGVPAALLAAQQSLQAALQRETILQAKLDHLAKGNRTPAAVRKRKPRSASGAS